MFLIRQRAPALIRSRMIPKLRNSTSKFLSRSFLVFFGKLFLSLSLLWLRINFQIRIVFTAFLEPVFSQLQLLKEDLACMDRVH